MLIDANYQHISSLKRIIVYSERVLKLLSTASFISIGGVERRVFGCMFIFSACCSELTVLLLVAALGFCEDGRVLRAARPEAGARGAFQRWSSCEGCPPTPLQSTTAA
ncbi:hypothetical protein SRHO_G00317350 [Serrasalmus rhombeus]